MSATSFEEIWETIEKLIHDDAYINTQNALFVAIACLIVLLVAYHRQRIRLKNAEYYLNIVKLVSRGLAKNQEIVAFNKDGRAIYTTHPHLYTTKHEFFRHLMGHVVASPELKTFCEDVDSNQTVNVLLRKLDSDTTETARRLIAVNQPIESGTAHNNEAITVSTVIDISQHVHESEQKADAYEKLEHFLDNMPLGIFYVDADNKIIGANTTFANLVSTSKNRILDIVVTDFIDGFDNSVAAQKPTLVTVNPRFAPPFRAMLVKSAVCSVSARQPWLIYRILVKNTADLEAEDGYFSQETFINSQIPAVIVNTKGEIKAINPAYATLVQDKITLDKSQKIKHETNISDLAIGTSGRSTLLEQIKKTNSDVHRQKPVEVQLAEGVVTHAYIARLCRQTTQTDSEQLLLVQFTDISAYKSLEQQFIQAQKMQAIGQLAGGVAHDFNNLLTAMIGFCDLLLQRYTPNDPSYADVMQIKQNAGRAAKLVKQLLAFSRQQTMVLKVISITDKLSDILTLLKRLIGIDVEFQIIHGKNIWPVKLDSNQFEQVIINLAVNARDAMNGKGKLTIRTRNYFSDKEFKCIYETAHAGDYVLIEVQDTGCGMTQETMNHIFEPFFSQSRKQNEKTTAAGVGLGLSTVYGIIKQIGGYINVGSQPGVGSCFKIYIPRYTGTELIQKKTQDKTSRDLSGTETILLVEDEDAVRAFSARALRDKGYKVLEAACGEDAIELAKTNIFDLLITDVVMPRIDGPTLNNLLKEKSKHLKTIFVSGYAEDTFRSALGRNSDIHFLQKPFTLKDLASKAKEVLGNG